MEIYSIEFRVKMVIYLLQFKNTEKKYPAKSELIGEKKFW